MNIKNKADLYRDHVQKSIEYAENGVSQLSREVLNIEGMSSSKVRHFLNNVCSLPQTSYLEIGCWKGSTLIAALFKNKESLTYAIAIDNWALHPDQNSKKIFLQNLKKYLEGYPLQFIEQNCFTINAQDTFRHPINIYFYDGNHNVASHEKAFTFFNNAFDNVFIAIIDDWNWERVRKGTQEAFYKLKYKIEYEQEFLTKGNDLNDWWNGIYIAIITKK